MCVYLDSLSCPCWVPWPQPSSYIQVAWKRACGHLERPISSQSVGGEVDGQVGGGVTEWGRWLSDSVGTQLEGRTGEARVWVVEVVLVVVVVGASRDRGWGSDKLSRGSGRSGNRAVAVQTEIVKILRFCSLKKMSL